MKTYLKSNKVESGRVVVSTICTIGGIVPSVCPYETMVFEVYPDRDEALRYSDLDSNVYYNQEDANQGHADMVAAWSE